MKYIFAITIVCLLFNMTITAEVRFVSKTGSSKAPYTSWETAADSIQKAINICKSGDTVYVGNGTYIEQVNMINGIALIGSGMDSCIIDTRSIAPRDREWFLITVGDSCSLNGFHLRATDFRDLGSYALSCYPLNIGSITNNFIQDAEIGIIGIFTNGIIKNNIFKDCQTGIRFGSIDAKINSIIEGNYFNVNSDGIYIPVSTPSITIRNNLFYMNNSPYAIWGSGHDSLYIYNNIIVGSGNSGITPSTRPATIQNNLVSGNFNRSAIFFTENYAQVKNNIAINKGGKGFWNYSQGSGKDLKYNNSWGSPDNYYLCPHDSTNLSVDPMVVSEDSLDFHLQMFSPMIHAGDPNIKNVDGTRSDIGMYGGPYGESYTYKDLAPRTPRNVTGSIKENNITLNWEKNTEADFSYYRVYRDTVASFIPDTTKRIAKINDTSFTQILTPGKNYYYKVSATDKQGNESPKSEEVKIITDVNNKIKVTAEDYKLFPNYPNPFNPSTKIGYRLNKPGNVRITVYDIKGSLVKELLNTWREAGYYEEEFTGQAGRESNAIDRLASGIYLLKIEIKNANNIPVFTDTRKMMMVK